MDTRDPAAKLCRGRGSWPWPLGTCVSSHVQACLPGLWMVQPRRSALGACMS